MDEIRRNSIRTMRTMIVFDVFVAKGRDKKRKRINQDSEFILSVILIVITMTWEINLESVVKPLLCLFIHMYVIFIHVYIRRLFGLSHAVYSICYPSLHRYKLIAVLCVSIYRHTLHCRVTPDSAAWLATDRLCVVCLALGGRRGGRGGGGWILSGGVVGHGSDRRGTSLNLRPGNTTGAMSFSLVSTAEFSDRFFFHSYSFKC